MRIQKFNKVGKFQDGGAIPAGDPSMHGGEQIGAEMRGAAGDEQAMIQQLSQMAAQVIQSVGPEAAAMLAQIIMEMLQGGQAPVGEQPQGEPIFKKGGKICGRMKNGSKVKKCGK